MKKCTYKNHKGDRLLPLNKFNKRKAANDGHHPWCKDCSSSYSRTHRVEIAIAQKKPIPRKNHKWLSVIDIQKRKEETQRKNNEASKLRKRLSPKNNIKHLIANIKVKCRRENIPFNISIDDFDDFPVHCPDLNVELIYGNIGKASPQSATIDKIIPKLGYICGNVRIISYRANTMKQNASLEEMKTIGESWINLFDKMKS